MSGVRRGLIWSLAGAVAVAGLAGVEAWPLTGWRLFSDRRQPVTIRFEARVVHADGSEAPVPFADLPHAFSGSVPVLDEMAGQAAPDREPACGAWAEATGRLTGAAVAEVRVYAVADDLRDGSSRAALAWTCGRRR
jgi:hypothetical protein